MAFEDYCYSISILYCKIFTFYLCLRSNGLEAPTIHVSSIEGNILFGYLESSSLCRLSFTQRSSDDLTVSNAETETKYLFTIRQNGNFSLHFDMSTITTKGVLVLYVNCDNGSSRSILNYKLDKKYYSMLFHSFLLSSV